MEFVKAPRVESDKKVKDLVRQKRGASERISVLTRLKQRVGY